MIVKTIASTFITLSIVVSITGCASEPADPATLLEKYLLNDSTLSETGWDFYTTQTSEKGTIAYLSFSKKQPNKSRKAPDEIELTRLCPDTRLHDFWQDTGLNSVELVLVKNIDLNKGKAKRLQQITCSDDFDLIAFETNTSTPEVTTVATRPAAMKETVITSRPGVFPTMILKISDDGRGYVKVERKYADSQIILSIFHDDKVTPNPPDFKPHIGFWGDVPTIRTTPMSTKQGEHVYIAQGQSLITETNKIITITYINAEDDSTRSYAVKFKDDF